MIKFVNRSDAGAKSGFIGTTVFKLPVRVRIDHCDFLTLNFQ